jgi:EmrB/QacA subfamily drug resistance transporter
LRQRVARSGIDRRWAVLAVVLSGLFTVAFTITVLSNALDRMATEFGTDRATMSWTITAPMLAFGVVGPAYGKLGDLHGHRRVFIFGLVGAGVFAACTALAWNAASLIIFRGLSATAGSATGPATMAYINQMFGPLERVKPLGYWSFVNAGAPVLGVVVGAPLVEQFGWRIIFIVQTPLCLAGAAVAFFLLPETLRRPGSSFDFRGALTLGIGASMALFAVSQGNRWGWGSSRFLVMFGIGAASLIAFLLVERTAPAPILPLPWLRRRNLVATIVSQSLTNFAYMGGFIMTPSVLQQGLGYSESASGATLVARPLAFAIAAPLAGMVTMRVGERSSGVIGSTAVASSMVLFALVTPSTSGWYIVLALALAGIGLGVALPALTSTVANAVDERDLGVAGALQQLAAQIGAVAGVAVMETVRASARASSAGAGSVLDSYSTAFWLAAVMAGLGAMAASWVRSTLRPSHAAAATVS